MVYLVSLQKLETFLGEDLEDSSLSDHLAVELYRIVNFVLLCGCNILFRRAVSNVLAVWSQIRHMPLLLFLASGILGSLSSVLTPLMANFAYCFNNFIAKSLT